MTAIFLLVGSESGNAEMVADCVTDELVHMGFEVTGYRGGAVEEAKLEDRALVLVCCSTTGIGDIPQNVEPLYEHLLATRPSLASARYGVIGLGDRNYQESFLGGPKKWDALLTELGATRLGARLELDATDNPTSDLDAVRWVREWAEPLR